MVYIFPKASLIKPVVNFRHLRLALSCINHKVKYLSLVQLYSFMSEQRAYLVLHFNERSYTKMLATLLQ